MRSRVGMFAVVWVAGWLSTGPAAQAQKPPGTEAATDRDDLSPALAPLEYLIGGWKGTGVPTANRIKGWAERHAWAWKFEKGAPVGLTVEMTGSKVVSKAVLSADPATDGYVLKGVGPDGKPVSFTGKLDRAARTLTLARQGAAPDGSLQRLTLFPNADLVRYTVQFDQRETGSPQYKHAIETGLTREGASFASGGAAAEGPKCVVTGGAATLTVSYNGTSYPLCCTGCRDEFNDNPEKYVKKLALMRTAGDPAKPSVSNAAMPGKDAAPAAGPADSTAAGKAEAAPSKTAKAAKSAKAAPKAADPATRALSLLTAGRNLEKLDKPNVALGYYRQILKDYPDTPSAKTAAERLKALTGK